jgi:hypothetical protein
MLRIEDWKIIFAAVGLVGVLVLASPVLSLVVRLPGGERFSELYMLGPGRMAEDYPFDVQAGRDYLVYLGVVNHLGGAEYYSVVVKLRNASEPLPNGTSVTPSPLLVLYRYHVFLVEGQSWEGALSFGFDGVVFGENVSLVGKVLVNGAAVPVDKVAAWDSVNSGYYYQLVVELWLYNAAERSFGYHNRFVSRWLNMTGSL